MVVMRRGQMGAPGMRRNKAFTRGRVLSVVVAGFAGYVIGGWNGAFPHGSALSASQTVALRFPQDSDDSSTAAIATAVAKTFATATATLGNPQFALLSPQPMVPQASDQSAPAEQASAAQLPAPQAPVQVASAEETTPVPQPVARPKPAVAAAAVRKVNERPGFVLNDAQIASIKERLHLTQDQEEMWPAVEAALRNLAYSRAREARRRGTQANTQQVASADPNSPDVQDLKSAAIPLLMSFNSEQKDEVRNLAHVMGLDQLANQF
jgi:hypothetical protein